MSNKLLLMVRPLVMSSVLAGVASNVTVTQPTPVSSPAKAQPDSPLPDCFPCCQLPIGQWVQCFK